jgi:hypothetical protein
VPSFGSRLPVFGDLILLVKFNFSPGCIAPPTVSDSDLSLSFLVS